MKKSNVISGIARSLVVAFIIFSTNSLTASNPLWTRDFKTNVNWQKVTPIGQLIASTGKGLVGINSDTGEEVWVIESLKNCSGNSYSTIPQSPFIFVSPSDGSSDINIVDPVEGKVVFSSGAAGLEKVTDQYFLYESGKILVIGTSKGGKNTEMVMVEMKSAKKLWSKSGAYSFITGAKDLGNNEVLMTSAFFASRINATDGSEIWKTAIDPKTAGMSSMLGMLEGFAASKISKDDILSQLITTPSAPGTFIIAAQKKNESTKVDSKGNKTVSISYTSVYMAFDIVTGKHKWPAVVELRFPLGVSYASERGLLVCSSSDGNINMLSYADGSKLLGKKGGGIGIKGTATGMVPLSDGKLLIAGSQGKNSSLSLLDPATGSLIFEKAPKIKGNVTYTEILKSGILVGTDEAVNVLNLTTGEWYNEDGLEGGAGLITSDDSGIYIFNTGDNLLYKLDPSNLSSFQKVSSTPLVFQGKEQPQQSEIYDGGILITSEQNMALIEKSGTVRYTSYFPAPGISDFRKALLIASAVRAAYYTAAFATYSAAFGAASQSIEVKDSRSGATKQVTGEISKAFGDATVAGAGATASYIKMAQQRFKATTQTNDYMLVMTSEGKKDAKLLQVSRKNGQVMNTILLGKDKEPVYDVDMWLGRLYYLKESSKIEGYQF
jgi:hypothetical protein